MALSKDLSCEKIVDAALTILAGHGLAALSMRQLAASLAVQPSALYWHIDSKQELLAHLADRILGDQAMSSAQSNLPVRQRVLQRALDIRAALLNVRDGADVVSFALALRPLDHSPTRLLHETLRGALPEPDAEWGAQTLTHYILGEVAEEQNHAELARAGIIGEGHATAYSTERFLFGIQVILDGLTDSGARPY